MEREEYRELINKCMNLKEKGLTHLQISKLLEIPVNEVRGCICLGLEYKKKEQ